ncbi:hypothetical protein LguiB_016123 [Lonicera macranthoides]
MTLFHVEIRLKLYFFHPSLAGKSTWIFRRHLRMESHGTGLRRVLVLTFCVVGIWSAYIYQGVLQETLSTKQFGLDKKRFEHLAFLNLAQSVVCLVWSFIMIKIWSSSGSGGAPCWSYWSAGITNNISPAMGIEALKYISYHAQANSKSLFMAFLMHPLNLQYSSKCHNTGSILLKHKKILFQPNKSRGNVPLSIGTYWMNLHHSLCSGIYSRQLINRCNFVLHPINFVQVLAKSSKMIPVMLMGTLVYGIRYTIPEYVCSLLVADGVSAFALSKIPIQCLDVFQTSTKTISKLAHPNAPLGYGLCFLNLAFDGFTNATQDSIATRYPKTSAWDIMLGMNFWGTIYNMAFMFGWPNASGFKAVQFCKQHPEAAWDIFFYCLWRSGPEFHISNHLSQVEEIAEEEANVKDGGDVTYKSVEEVLA